MQIEGGDNVITHQEFVEGEGGKIKVRNTIDVSEAIAKAKEEAETGGRGKNIVPLGFIPPEYWNFDPWLMEARKAQAAGDKFEYQKYVRKFFSTHPQFAVLHSAKYWSGA